jgi:hypothetical protein
MGNAKHTTTTESFEIFKRKPVLQEVITKWCINESKFNQQQQASATSIIMGNPFSTLLLAIFG